MPIENINNINNINNDIHYNTLEVFVADSEMAVAKPITGNKNGIVANSNDGPKHQDKIAVRNKEEDNNDHKDNCASDVSNKNCYSSVALPSVKLFSLYSFPLTL